MNVPNDNDHPKLPKPEMNIENRCVEIDGEKYRMKEVIELVVKHFKGMK